MALPAFLAPGQKVSGKEAGPSRASARLARPSSSTWRSSTTASAGIRRSAISPQRSLRGGGLPQRWSSPSHSLSTKLGQHQCCWVDRSPPRRSWSACSSRTPGCCAGTRPGRRSSLVGRSCSTRWTAGSSRDIGCWALGRSSGTGSRCRAAAGARLAVARGGRVAVEWVAHSHAGGASVRIGTLRLLVVPTGAGGDADLLW